MAFFFTTGSCYEQIGSKLNAQRLCLRIVRAKTRMYSTTWDAMRFGSRSVFVTRGAWMMFRLIPHLRVVRRL